MDLEIGRRIAKFRAIHGMKQKDLAEILGVKRETISQWEHSDRDIKSGDIVLLAKAFHVTTDELLTGELPSEISNISLSKIALSNLENLSENKKAFVKLTRAEKASGLYADHEIDFYGFIALDFILSEGYTGEEGFMLFYEIYKYLSATMDSASFKDFVREKKNDTRYEYHSQQDMFVAFFDSQIERIENILFRCRKQYQQTIKRR